MRPRTVMIAQNSINFRFLHQLLRTLRTLAICHKNDLALRSFPYIIAKIPLSPIANPADNTCNTVISFYETKKGVITTFLTR